MIPSESNDNDISDIGQSQTLLKLESVVVEYDSRYSLLRSKKGESKKSIRAVDGVSFEIRNRTTFGLVGESGCGKTTLCKAILRLVPLSSGKIVFEGKDISRMKGKELFDYRRKVQVVFQDPYATLDPRQRILDSILEPLMVHGQTRNEANKIACKMLEEVGLRPNQFQLFPHQFSGGQRQRICIARALALAPKLLILDEPTSALDVSIQAQILLLLRNLQIKFGLTYLFISHNLSVIKMMSDYVASMFNGKIVEEARKGKLFLNAAHPYTQRLISAIPEPFPNETAQYQNTRTTLESARIEGPGSSLSSPQQRDSVRDVGSGGCLYQNFCPYVFERCRAETPLLQQIEFDHKVSCHLYPDQINSDIRRQMTMVVNRKRISPSTQV